MPSFTGRPTNDALALQSLFVFFLFQFLYDLFHHFLYCIVIFREFPFELLQQLRNQQEIT